MLNIQSAEAYIGSTKVLIKNILVGIMVDFANEMRSNNATNLAGARSLLGAADAVRVRMRRETVD